MTQIPGIYVAIKGDFTALKKDLNQARQYVTEQSHGISNALNNALSPGQIQQSVKGLISELNRLSNNSKITGNSFANLGVDLGELRKHTGLTEAEFAKLQQKLLQTHAARTQEGALRRIAKQANLTTDEIRGLGHQFGLSSTQIDRITGTADTSSTAINRVGKESVSTTQKMRDMIATVAIYTGAFAVMHTGISSVVKEIKTGFSAVEDFNRNVAASAAYITTFSDKAKSGDIAGAYRDATVYAARLAEKLEMIDAKTVATGKDLQVMSETFLQHGVLLDINNKRQVDGFTNIANALALVTAGQNKDIQLRQEINALMLGQVRATDRLPKLLSKADPMLQEHIKLWREEGTIIENIGRLLVAFSAQTGDIDRLWLVVGSTMQTINDRVLRGAFEPAYNDLIDLAQKFNDSLVDSAGHLTPLAKQIQEKILSVYENGKNIVKEYGDEVSSLVGFLVGAKTAQLALNIAISKSPYIVAAAGLMFMNEQMEKVGNNLGSLDDKWQTYTKHFNLFWEAVTGKRDAHTGRELTRQEQIVNEIAELNDMISGDKEWWQFSIFKDPVAEQKYIEGIKGRIADLQQEYKELGKSSAEYIDSWQRIKAPKISAQNEDVKTETDTYIDSWQLAYDDRDAIQSRMLGVLAQREDEAIKEGERRSKLAEQAQRKLISDSIRAAKSDGYVDSWELQYRDRYEVQSRYLDLMVTNEGSAFQDMENAVSGWASGFGESLSDAVWAADFSFSQIAESFGRMITEMAMQYAIVRPLMVGLFGSKDAGVEGLLTSFLHHSGGMVGLEPSGTRSVPTRLFASAPRFHSGLMPGEFPAILQKGEGVFTKGQMAALGAGMGGSNVNVNIINNAGVDISTKETPGANGGIDFEIILDRAVGKLAGRTGTATNKAVMSSTSSSVPLVRR